MNMAIWREGPRIFSQESNEDKKDIGYIENEVSATLFIISEGQRFKAKNRNAKLIEPFVNPTWLKNDNGVDYIVQIFDW